MLEVLLPASGRIDGRLTGRGRLTWLLLLPVLMAACIPKGVRVPQNPLLGALERKAGLIAYVGSDGNIYAVDQGGGNKRPITSDAVIPTEESDNQRLQIYLRPAWSPDSKQLAFVGFSGSSGAPESPILYVASVEDPQPSKLFESEQGPFYLYWSPDSAFVTFLNNAPSGLIRLQMVSVEGGEPVLLDAGQPYYWAWAPNGRQLLTHVAGSSPEARLSVLSLEELVIETVLDLQPSIFQAPAWSADGRQLLVATVSEEGGTELVITDQQGDSVTVLDSLEDERFVAFDWSPDGQNVAYIASSAESPQVSQGSLTVVDPAQPDDVLASVDEDVAAFFWSPDSTKIAYFVIEALDTQADESDEDTADAQQTIILTAYVLDVQKGESVQIAGPYQPTQAFLEVLAFFNQYQRSATIWSPDSRNVVLTGLSSTGPVVLVVAASGKLEPRQIANGSIAFWSWG